MEEIVEDPPSYEAAMAESNTQLSASSTLLEAPSTPPVSFEVPMTPSVTFKVPSAPPAPSEVPSEPTAPPPALVPHAMQPTFGILTDETIRKACSEYAERNFKNGSRIIEHMSFSNKRSFYSLHYKLETFLEWRDSVIKNEKCKVYTEKAIDGSKNGPEPNLRSIFVVCKQKFQYGETHVPIPHSERLRTCRKCDDRGKEDCPTCKGAGWNPCSSCGGEGYLKGRSACSTCNKTGRLICDPCYSSGRINCLVCDGYKKFKSYKELKVTWTNHVDEYDSNPTDIPTDLLKSSNGNEIFSEESPRVQPLTLFPDTAINIASLNLVFKHQKECANKVVLLQRHSIRAIPITKISYHFKGITGDFYVYGVENNVYFENFFEVLDYISLTITALVL